jgi:rod shape-determining protein MreC
MRASLSIRQGTHRSTFALFLLLAVGIMLIGKADPALYERTRMAITDIVTPVIGILSSPVAASANMIEEGKHLLAAYDENEVLREENDRLSRWHAVAQSLESENARLRALLNFAPEPEASYITGRVIGDSGGAFLRSVLVNVGARDGVRKGFAAVDDRGLVGRVAEVGQRSARILLITDLNSRIPVFVGEQRERAILAGDNSDFARLDYLPPERSIGPGDLVVTSGHGGAFPADLPVGIVVPAGDEGSTQLQVKPFLAPDRLEFVRLMDFGLTGVLQDQDLGLADQ